MSLGVLNDLIRHRDALEAAAPPAPAEPLSDSALLEIFALLQAVPNVDRTLLSRSKVALAVAKFRQGTSPAVCAAARKLVLHWKNTVGPKTVAATKSAATPNATTSSGHASENDSGNAVGTTEAGDTSFSETQRDAKSDSGSLFADPHTSGLQFAGPYSNDIKRDRAREILFEAFVKGIPVEQLTGLNSLMIGHLMASVEVALYETYCGGNPSNAQRFSLRDYQLQLRSIRANFADRKNPEFNIRVYLGAISAEQLAVMPSTEMASDAKKAERQRAKRDALEACQSDWDLRNIKRAAGQFPCGKCKSANTTYVQIQTRSSDEPMTTYVNCLECGNRWKF